MEHPEVATAAAPQQQEQQQQSTTDAARTTQEDAFDSVRQAAAAMFKQRTKDLTRLAEVEVQCQDVEAELRQAQSCIAQLTAHQAALDAVVDEEQQRTRQREACLQDLHGALLQLDEEQQTSSRLQHAAEAAIAAATAFIQEFTDPEGRLFQLLTMASAQTAGRSARELQGVLAEVQQCLSAAAAHQQRLRATPSVSMATTPASAHSHDGGEDEVASAVERTLRVWAARVDWGRHRELADAAQAMQNLQSWCTRWNGSQAQAGPEERYVDHDAWPPLPPCVAAAAVNEDGGDADAQHWLCALHLQPTQTDHDAEEESPTSTTAPTEGDVRQLIQAELLTPLDAIPPYSTQLAAACAQHRVRPPDGVSCLAASVAAAHARWDAVRVAWQEWNDQVRRTQEAVQAAGVAERQLAAAQDALEALRQRSAAQDEYIATRRTELAEGGELQRAHHAAAWTRGLRTLQAQRASLVATSSAASAAEAEAHRAAAELEESAARHEQACHTLDAERGEHETQTTAARQSATAAEARTAELEVEYAELQRVQQSVRDHHAALLVCAEPRRSEHGASTPAGTGSAEHLSEPLQRLATACLPVSSTCHAWVSKLAKASGAAVAAVGPADSAAVTTAASAFFAQLASGSDDAGAKSTSTLDVNAVGAALAEAVATLQLSDCVLASDAVDAELLSQLPSLHALMATRQATCLQSEEHRAFMRDATAEATLLSSELTSAHA